MPSRREFLRHSLVVPIAAGSAGLAAATGPRIIAGPDCLSQESAEGFRPVLAASGASVVVLCGTSCMDRFYGEALRGAWIIYERSPFAMGGVESAASELYVRYRWPHDALIRCFSRMVPVACPEAEVIAHYGGMPVAQKRRIGHGGMLFLGSMLGPNLRAGELEARQLATAIFSEIACAGTSTAG